MRSSSRGKSPWSVILPPPASWRRWASIVKKTGVRTDPSRGSMTTLRSVTDPILTPLNVTGAPLSSPSSDPSK